ncbi:hypothetical protein BUE93_16945 [Chromobacterium amazonense]|uniref:DUF2946 domain-containing protein n=1 Tax=Chromobacterium amazonense TaxID=1382803 RepID=A0A2S9X180_9NEIS|nr:DUF2946 family protein [Chromobacterium amazonense]PRP69467.1 hypothetical protein BUE93_16945 [Chromobacterium amazonense]
MDAIVLAAMAKWPNVPAVFGWLRLDARGQWWIKDERLQHEGMAEFFNRNYSRDGQGRCYVQNGPQKVYVTLDAAPLVARRTPKGWSTQPYDDDVPARSAWLTPDGVLLLEIGGELAVVDDRDLPSLLDEGLPGWDGDMAALPTTLKLPEAVLPLASETLPALQSRYGIVARPK